MKKKSIYCYLLAVLMCLSLLPAFPGKINVASAAEKDMVLYMKFDGNLEDASGNANHGESTYGKITYEEGIFGQCAVFNGKSYVEVMDSDSLDLKDNFTISLWAYKEDMNQDFVPFVYKQEDEACWASPYQLYEHFKHAPAIYMHDGDMGTELNQFRVDGTEIDIRKWFLLTATYNGKEVRLYNNGQLMRKASVTGSPAATVNNLFVGMMNGLDGAIYYKGKMDDLRIYNRALSADEVIGIYKDGVASNPKLLKQTNALVANYKFENNFKDSTSYGNDAERVTGEGSIKFVDAVCGKGAKFTKGSYLEIKDNDSINFDEGFTLTGWVCVNKSDIVMPIVHRIGVSTSDDSNEFAYDYSVSNTQCGFQFAPFIDGGAGSWYSYSSSMLNKWYHIGVTFDTNEVRFYKNGELVQKEELEGLKIAHADGSLMIGSDGQTFFEGTLDELKLYNYALSAAEIKGDAARMDSLSISQANINSIKALKVKKTVTLQTSRKYVDTGKSEVVKAGVTYKSSNKKVFTVSATGKITAINKGTANLTISHGGISKTYKVTVK